MTPRHWDATRQRVTPCAGSGKRAQHRRGQIGYCPDCGVRTFTRSDLIRPHGSSALEIHAQRLRPRKPAQ